MKRLLVIDFIFLALLGLYFLLFGFDIVVLYFGFGIFIIVYAYCIDNINKRYRNIDKKINNFINKNKFNFK